MLLLPSHFSRVRLCATPETAAHQASPPWDSPGKNTGVSCYFLLQCMQVKTESEVTQSCLTRATPWTAAHQAPPSKGFSRQKYWSGVPLPSPVVSLVISFYSISNWLLYKTLNKVGNPALLNRDPLDWQWAFKNWSPRGKAFQNSRENS